MRYTSIEDVGKILAANLTSIAVAGFSKLISFVIYFAAALPPSGSVSATKPVVLLDVGLSNLLWIQNIFVLCKSITGLTFAFEDSNVIL